MPDPSKGLTLGEQRLWDAAVVAVLPALIAKSKHSTVVGLAAELDNAAIFADALVVERRKRSDR